MGIKNQMQEDARLAQKRARFVRYGAVAAAVTLVVAGALGIALSRPGAGNAAPKASLENANAATISDAEAVAAEAPEAAVLEAIAEAVEGTASTAAADEETLDEAVTTAASYDALYALMERLSAQNGRDMAKLEAAAGASESDGASAAAEPAAAADMGAAGGAAHSGTNVQVAGVDEADIVKTDGSFIYYIANDTLTILEADGRDTKQLSATPLASDDAWWGYASEMFLSGDRLLLITQGMTVVRVANGGSTYEDNRDETQVRVYDVKDRTNPRLIATLAQSGGYVSSRMANGMVYLVTTQYVWRPVRTLPATFVPQTRADGASKTLPAEDIYLYGSPRNTAYTVIGAIDTRNPQAYAGVKAVFGGTGELYCNGKSLLMACPQYDEEVSDIAPDESGRNVQVTTSRSQTKLMLFSLDGGEIRFTANGTVAGTLLNQFAMHEHNGVFSIVTSVNNWTQRIYTDGVDTYEYEDSTSNGLYTFDETLTPLGALDNLAPDEWVESVRFDGDIAYFVTFRQVDPLFTVDLRDPKSPRLLSALKIPGFSEYLHVYGDGLLLGIGYAADENTGGTQGVKLTMFDTSDRKDVSELATERVDAGWTVVGSNHKAILVDPGKNLIAFPADSAYYIYSFAADTGFTQLARVAMTEDLYSWNLRGLFIGDFFYVLGDGAVTVIAMADWKPVAKVTI